MSAESGFIKRDLLDPAREPGHGGYFFWKYFFEKVKVLVITFHMSLYPLAFQKNPEISGFFKHLSRGLKRYVSRHSRGR